MIDEIEAPIKRFKIKCRLIRKLFQQSSVEIVCRKLRKDIGKKALDKALGEGSSHVYRKLETFLSDLRKEGGEEQMGPAEQMVVTNARIDESLRKLKEYCGQTTPSSFKDLKEILSEAIMGLALSRHRTRIIRESTETIEELPDFIVPFLEQVDYERNIPSNLRRGLEVFFTNSPTTLKELEKLCDAAVNNFVQSKLWRDVLYRLPLWKDAEGNRTSFVKAAQTQLRSDTNPKKSLGALLTDDFKEAVWPSINKELRRLDYYFTLKPR